VLGGRSLTEWIALLWPTELIAVCMAYFQLRSQGYFKSGPLKPDGKWRFSILDLLVVCTIFAAVVVFMRNTIYFHPLLNRPVPSFSLPPRKSSRYFARAEVAKPLELQRLPPREVPK
jgi:hypothetical protein